MNTIDTLIALAGLTVITVVTRCFFFMSERELPIPHWLREGLRHAPLAALAAIIAPAVLLSPDGQWLQTWQDARLPAVAAAVAWFVWRRTLLGTIVSGTVVMLVLRLGWGW